MRAIRHGTTDGYTNHGCRCGDCSRANTESHGLYMRRRRAGDALDAIRLAVVGAANDAVAVEVIREILERAPEGKQDARSVQLLLRAITRRKLRLAVPACRHQDSVSAALPGEQE